MKRTLVLLLAATGLALVACGGTESKPSSQPQPTSQRPPTSTSAKPQVMKFGEDRKGTHGVLNVSAPVPFDLPADPARNKDLTRGLRFDIKVSNSGQQALQASDFVFTVTTDGQPAVLVTDEGKQVTGKLGADVLPGKEGKASLVVAAPTKPAEISVKIAFQKGNPLYWTGTV
ncbi:hypothetical protein GCM10010174_70450 [Kutzneria viridogrisea]|uniref:DUF4352 domain-containing protein n=2 Tax=Kutzneria TaxID=43356 RepID=W5WC21_9PSEU|nr:hypothetical protein [Kutzneria albida]AHH98452.1 hypothetical protein KALB_5090 [Kutzneria albida DSM 43870]MBA8923963.1 hypothetical protein [Kutzneria viridogrisea]